MDYINSLNVLLENSNIGEIFMQPYSIPDENLNLQPTFLDKILENIMFYDIENEKIKHKRFYNPDITIKNNKNYFSGVCKHFSDFEFAIDKIKDIKITINSTQVFQFHKKKIIK